MINNLRSVGILGDAFIAARWPSAVPWREPLTTAPAGTGRERSPRPALRVRWRRGRWTLRPVRMLGAALAG